MNILPHLENDSTSIAAYWGVIPAPVRYCKSLPPAAKLLFSEITALCKREGYCWASNSHFQALYGVDRATVKRWLAALSREGFVRVDLIPGTGERRIYDLTIPPAQKRASPGAKTNPPRRKNVTDPAQKRAPEWYIELEKEKEKESDARGGRFVGPGPVPAWELGRQEEQVTASPSTTKSKSEKGGPSAARLRQVQRVVSLTKDAAGRETLEAMWDKLQEVSRPEAWAESVERVKVYPGRATMAPERLTEVFLAVCSCVADLDH